MILKIIRLFQVLALIIIKNNDNKIVYNNSVLESNLVKFQKTKIIKSKKLAITKSLINLFKSQNIYTNVKVIRF